MNPLIICGSWSANDKIQSAFFLPYAVFANVAKLIIADLRALSVNLLFDHALIAFHAYLLNYDNAIGWIRATVFGRLFPQVTLMIGKKTDGWKAVGGRGLIRSFSLFYKGEDDNLPKSRHRQSKTAVSFRRLIPFNFRHCHNFVEDGFGMEFPVNQGHCNSHFPLHRIS